MEYYEVPDQLRRHRKMGPLYVLVVGRYSEFEHDPKLNLERAELARPNETLATFDRLTPDPLGRDIFSVARHQTGYHAIAFPPTFRFMLRRPTGSHAFRRRNLLWVGAHGSTPTELPS